MARYCAGCGGWIDDGEVRTDPEHGAVHDTQPPHTLDGQVLPPGHLPGTFKLRGAADAEAPADAGPEPLGA